MPLDGGETDERAENGDDELWGAPDPCSCEVRRDTGAEAAVMPNLGEKALFSSSDEVFSSPVPLVCTEVADKFERELLSSSFLSDNAWRFNFGVRGECR